MTFLSALWGRFAGYVMALGALLTILIGAYAKGRREGKAIIEAEQARARQQAIANKRKLDSEIDDLAPADLDHRFKRWLQPEKRR